MKFRSKKIDKAEKQMLEAKTVINYSSLETGCDLCLQRLSCKSIEKLFKKYKAQNPKLFQKTDIFESHNRLRIKIKKGYLYFNTSGSQLDRLIMRLCHEPTKKQIQKEAKTSNNFTT